MNCISQVAASIAAGLHVMFFITESFRFKNPTVYPRFGAATPAAADACELFATNMGFYNLFLAIGVAFGLALLNLGPNIIAGQTLVLFSCFCMLGAGVVLFGSSSRVKTLRYASVAQGLFPLLAWGFWFWRH